LKKLGFGVMRLPLLDEKDPASIDMERMKEMVDAFLEQGFNYFDTAWMYCGGKSQSALKEALVLRHPRNRFLLTTKLSSYLLKTREDRDRIFDEQLEQTGVEFFDCYLLHNVNSRSIEVFESMDCFTWLEEKKLQGKAKAIGFSYHDGPELLDKILTNHPCVQVVQLQINYLDWESAGVQSRRCYEVARKHNKAILVMEPVKGGKLADVPLEVAEMFRAKAPEMSIPSWAIRFAASLEGVEMVLSGMSNMEQLLDNTGYMSDFKPLTEEEVSLVHRAADIINGETAISCTACSYCTVECPKNIPIPQYFSLYNADRREKPKGWSVQEAYYENYTVQNGKPSDCVGCGKCEEICPQHLPVRKYLKEVGQYFDEKAD